MAKETPAQAAARFRKMAQDPNLPQAVKNTYLDKANEVEKAAAKPTMAKGGVVAKATPAKAALPKRGERTATNKANKAKPALAIMIGVGKPKMAKGGAVKKGSK